MTPTTPSAEQVPLTRRGLRVGILGGTGPQGSGLAVRFAAAGLEVVLGSRDSARAREVAAGLAADAGSEIAGTDNVGAADCEVVVVAVPWVGHADLLTALSATLAGRIVVDCVNPLGFDKRGAFALGVPEGSAAQQAEALLPHSRVVGAFHHLSAALLGDPAVLSLDQDVMVVGDDREATDLVQELAELLPGVRGVYAGRLRNAGQVEALTANLISVNRRYRTHAGIRISSLNPDASVAE
jgi:8-hydroxy-5-deazaflavin:NADPH oxidoreductase